MQNLGELFPESTRNQLAKDNLKIGAVLKYHSPFTNPPKEKRAIIVSMDAHQVLFAIVLINTEINPNVFPTKELQDLNLKVEATDRPYLDHDSYIDCSQIFEQGIESVEAILTESPSIHIGDLSEADLKKVKDAIRGAITITPKVKKKFGLI